MHIYAKTYEGDFKELVDAEVKQIEEMGEITKPLARTTLGGVEGYMYSASTLGRFTHYYLPTDEGRYLMLTYMVEDPSGVGFKDTVNSMLASFSVN